MKSSFLRLALVVGLAGAVTGRSAIVLEQGKLRAVIVVPVVSTPTDAQARLVAQSVAEAGAELGAYFGKASGAQAQIVTEDRLGEIPAAFTRIYVGPCRATQAAVNVEKLQPEGFIIKVSGREIFIVGNDRAAGGLAVTGTAYGCYDFLERFLGVRWLMPGELGEVIPHVTDLSVTDTEIRQEPLLWLRKIRNSELNGMRERMTAILHEWGVSVQAWESAFSDEKTDPWFRHQRIGGRVKLTYGHAYAGWWDRYHEKYPEIFALQPDGTRNTGGYRETFCVSNPLFSQLVAQEKIRELRADPLLTAASVSPNDGGSSKHCMCEACKAWDAKHSRPVNDDDPDGAIAGAQLDLSDRYFRFYNEVGKLVAKEFPDRFLGCYAYSIYRRPPIELGHLENNLIVGFVGFESYLDERKRAQDREEWLGWSRQVKQLFVRPNLFWGWLGLPQNYTRRLASDLRFMAANGMRAADYDGLVGNWGSDGLNYYTASRLLWDVNADVDAITNDYCQAAYGHGAPMMKAYYARLEKLGDQIATEGKFRSDSQEHRFLGADKSLNYYTDELLAELHHYTDQAETAIGESDARAKARVELVKTCLEYVPHVRTLVLAAAAVRNGSSSVQEFNPILKRENEYFSTLALSWSVSTPHNYWFIRKTLELKPAK